MNASESCGLTSPPAKVCVYMEGGVTIRGAKQKKQEWLQ